MGRKPDPDSAPTRPATSAACPLLDKRKTRSLHRRIEAERYLYPTGGRADYHRARPARIIADQTRRNLLRLGQPEMIGRRAKTRQLTLADMLNDSVQAGLALSGFHSFEQGARSANRHRASRGTSEALANAHGGEALRPPHSGGGSPARQMFTECRHRTGLHDVEPEARALSPRREHDRDCAWKRVGRVGADCVLAALRTIGQDHCS
jgi:hypothetical protein